MEKMHPKQSKVVMLEVEMVSKVFKIEGIVHEVGII